jgi:hypothetical protein
VHPNAHKSFLQQIQVDQKIRINVYKCPSNVLFPNASNVQAQSPTYHALLPKTDLTLTAISKQNNHITRLLSKHNTTAWTQKLVSTEDKLHIWIAMQAAYKKNTDQRVISRSRTQQAAQATFLGNIVKGSRYPFRPGSLAAPTYLATSEDCECITVISWVQHSAA